MRPRWQLLIVMSMLAGCQSSSKAPYADNPLLLSREPLKQTANNNKPAKDPNVTQTMPAATPVPSVIRQPVAQLTSSTSPPADTPPKSANVQQVTATSNTETSVPEKKSESVEAKLPVKLPAPPMPIPVNAVSPPSSRFGHATDYAWLIGEFDVHYRGHKELRFCPNNEENSIGGKVRLVDHPQLGELKAGDHVRIEGELVRDDPMAVGGEYPRYHIRTIQILNSKQ